MGQGHRCGGVVEQVIDQEVEDGSRGRGGIGEATVFQGHQHRDRAAAIAA